jgi:hypothetical protein
LATDLPQHAPPEHPRRHIELYEEHCQRVQDQYNPGGPKLTPFDEWVEDSVELDQVVNEGGMDEIRIIIHDCVDGDGYFWSCGGWYCRDSHDETGPSGQTVWVPGPWTIETAFHFGGDSGPNLEIFWKASLGFRPVRVA